MKSNPIKNIFYVVLFEFMNLALFSQTKDSIPCQPLSILLTGNGETELGYVLPRAKQLFIKELNNINSKVHTVLNKEIQLFYNDDGILIRDSDYPLKISQNEFLLSPLSYYFEFDNLDSGYLIHSYTFLVTIPIIQTARKIRTMGTINLILLIEDKEVINLAEDNLQKDNTYINKWRTLKSYKRIITIKDIKGFKILEAKADYGSQ